MKKLGTNFCAHWQPGVMIEQLFCQHGTASVYCELLLALLFFGLFYENYSPMFLKTYRLKSSAALKGSEARKLRARVELAFPHISAENLLPAKANVTQLKILTHAGVPSVVYCVDKLPMFFELDGGQLVPTLYALWVTHDILPYFTTHEGVLPKLSNGADLMLPGVVPLGVGLSMYGNFKKGQLSM